MNFIEAVEKQYAERLGPAQGAEKNFRERAWSEYQRLGLPDRKNEAWKYSTLSSISKTAWTPAANAAAVPTVARELIRDCRGEFDIAVMMNGKLNVQESVFTAKSGFEFKPRTFSEASGIAYDDGFFSLSAALNVGGYELTVAEGARAVRPLLVIHCQQGERSWSSTVNRIALAKNSQVQLAEVFIGGESAEYLCTDISDVEIAEGAELTWVRAQQEREGANFFSEVQVRLAERARLSLTQINSGGAWARGSLKVSLNGEQAAAQINGISFGRDRQHVDQRVQISHQVGNTNSSQLFKGILKDHARGVLNGKIFIARNAQKVVSSQHNHCLLLSSTAEADTKPELEVYADDVKANHGASVGRMDDEKLFYLISRGLKPETARQMLAQAFVADVLMKIPTPLLRDFALKRVQRMMS